MRMVADAGPILSCTRANRLELPRQIVGELTIPDAVYEDIVVRGAGRPGSPEAEQASWSRRLSVRARVAVDRLPPRLHVGAREAITLANERNASLLVDAREARREARRQGITVVGSLQVL